MCELRVRGEELATVTALRCNVAAAAEVCLPTVSERNWLPLNRLQWLPFKSALTVFVTTDPSRDNPRMLRTWLNHFDKSFIGLTGTEAAVEAAQMAAHVPLSRCNPDGHAAFVLAYTKDNLAHVIYPAGVSQADWVHDLPQLARETWTSR
jgi:cytochrome oxidase Cu insertion factor (SCO1/SenC/PrrC family)